MTTRVDRRLPEKWQKSELGDLIEMAQYGLSVRGQRSGRYPILRMNCQDRGSVVFRDLQFVDLDAQTFEKYKLRDGDLLFNRTNSFELVGRSALCTEPQAAVFASYLIRLRVHRDKILPQFLNFFLQHGSTQAALKGFATRGVSQSNISASKLRKLQVVLPSLSEQAVICEALQRLQDAVRVQERLVTTLKALRAATMAKLFREGLRGEPLKKTEIGEIPRNWEVVSVGGLFEIQLGKMLSQKARFGPTMKPYLRNANVQWGRVDLHDVFEMSFDDREVTKFALRPNDILVCEGGEPGRTALWHGEMPDCLYQKAVHRLRPKNGLVSPKYYVHWAYAAFKVLRTHDFTNAKTTIAQLPAVKLAALKMALPSIEEQTELIETLDKVDEKLSLEQRKMNALEETFSVMLHHLMTGRLRLPLSRG